MDLGKLLFGQSYNEATDPYMEAAKSARDDAISAQFVEGITPEERVALVQAADEYANQAATDYANAVRENQYNVLGNGLIGTLLSPIAQSIDVASGSGDVALKSLLGQELTDEEKGKLQKAAENPITGSLENRYSEQLPLSKDIGGVVNEWEGDRNRYNLVSDLGAMINLLATAAGGAGLGANMGVGSKALLEAGLGGAQQAGYGMQQRGNLGNEDSNILSDIGTGAAFGAAFPLLGGAASKVAQRGENYLANQALASGLASDASTAANIAKNTGGLTKARAAFSSLPKAGKIGLAGTTAAGGLALGNLLKSRSTDNQTGYDDDAVYGSDNYGTTQGYNYGTYGY